MGAQLLLPGADLGQAEAYDGRADQPLSGQVHALAKHAAQHCKAQQRAPRRGGELRQKVGTAGLVHGGVLPQGLYLRVSSAEHLPHLLQIAVTGEERQVIPGAGTHHLVQQRGDLFHAVRPVLVPGADVPRTPQP